MTTWQPCDCPEASLLRDILTGEVPAADTPTWRLLADLIEARAAARAVHIARGASLAVSTATDWAAIAGNPSHAELVRRRYPPDGDVQRWVAHGERSCPAPPCAGTHCTALIPAAGAA